jgi:hypothetical protein
MAHRRISCDPIQAFALWGGKNAKQDADATSEITGRRIRVRRRPSERITSRIRTTAPTTAAVVAAAMTAKNVAGKW